MEQTPDQTEDTQPDDTNEEQAPQPEQSDQASGTPDPNLAADGDEVKDGIEDNEE